MQQVTQTHWQHHLEEAHTPAEVKKSLEDRQAEGWELVDVVLEQATRTTEPYKTNRARRDSTWHLFFKRPAT